ncbi:hypothetical protein EUTSA_v10021937mg, partial [Eutrema salsugineum]
MDSVMENNSSGSDEELQDDQESTVNERVIYQAALQDMKQPKTEKDLPFGVLSVPLMRHQKIALEWMRKKEKRKLHCLGGILADDQGLGKTISTIALILLQKLKSQSKPRKPRSQKSGGTLIVCPASVVKQWARELDEKVSNEHKLSVLVYHGSKRTKDPTELAKHDVVVTTYAIVTNEVPQNPLLDFCESKKRGRETTERPPSSSGALKRVRWLRVVLDEAQTIKNRRTQVARACFSLKAKGRWCLSGTPIQNKIDDLYSYFRFLRYHPYAMYKSFRRTIKTPLTKNPLHGYKKLQAVLRAIMLRRTKEVEWSFYRKLEILAQHEFEEYAAGNGSGNYAHMLVMLLRLRQACNHPQLLRGYIDSDDFSSYTKEAVRTIPRESLIILLNLLKSSSNISCSVCSSKTLCGHVFCFECVSQIINGDPKTCPVQGCSTELAPKFVFSESKLRSCIKDYEDHDGKNAFRVQVMLMSLKAGNLGLNMVAACHVILLDLWWNPTTEDQAIDRAHRIGQTRTVTVTRIAVNNTVEDRILALQERKREMVASALGENH